MNDEDNDDDDPVTFQERSNAAFNLIQLLLPNKEVKVVDGDSDPLRNVGWDLVRDISDALIRVHDSAVLDLTPSTTDEGGI